MLCTVAIIHLRLQNTAVICAVLLQSCFLEILGTISFILTLSETVNVCYCNDVEPACCHLCLFYQQCTVNLLVFCKSFEE